jgi:hypothetical protein
MNSVRSMWAMVQGDPKFMRRVNGWFTIFWIAMIPISFSFHWLSSVTYVSALSLWALVSGHWSAWQAARVEVAQQKEEQKDTEGKIAKRIIKETNLQKSATAKKPKK